VTELGAAKLSNSKERQTTNSQIQMSLHALTSQVLIVLDELSDAALHQLKSFQLWLQTTTGLSSQRLQLAALSAIAIVVLLYVLADVASALAIPRIVVSTTPGRYGCDEAKNLPSGVGLRRVLSKRQHRLLHAQPAAFARFAITCHAHPT
jgi:hypothetical protein